MVRRPGSKGDTQEHPLTGADMIAPRANLAMSPAQRIAEFVAMNRFHADVQDRTLPPWLRAALEAREIDAARLRLEEVGA